MIHLERETLCISVNSSRFAASSAAAAARKCDTNRITSICSQVEPETPRPNARTDEHLLNFQCHGADKLSPSS